MSWKSENPQVDIQEANLEQGADKQRNILQAMTKVVQPEDMDGVSLAHQKEGGGERKKKNHPQSLAATGLQGR